MLHKITLKGNPISTQSAYWHTWTIRFLTPKARILKQAYILQARSQWRGKKPLQWDLCFHIKIFFGNKRKHDRDNFNKLSIDSLEWIVIENDEQIQLCIVEKFYDKENPRQEIVICSYEDKKELLDYYLTMESQKLSQ